MLMSPSVKSTTPERGANPCSITISSSLLSLDPQTLTQSGENVLELGGENGLELHVGGAGVPASTCSCECFQRRLPGRTWQSPHASTVECATPIDAPSVLLLDAQGFFGWVRT